LQQADGSGYKYILNLEYGILRKNSVGKTIDRTNFLPKLQLSNIGKVKFIYLISNVLNRKIAKHSLFTTGTIQSINLSSINYNSNYET